MKFYLIQWRHWNRLSHLSLLIVCSLSTSSWAAWDYAAGGKGGAFSVGLFVEKRVSPSATLELATQAPMILGAAFPRKFYTLLWKSHLTESLFFSIGPSMEDHAITNKDSAVEDELIYDFRLRTAGIAASIGQRWLFAGGGWGIEYLTLNQPLWTGTAATQVSGGRIKPSEKDALIAKARQPGAGILTLFLFAAI